MGENEIRLTEKEKLVLKALYESASGNGHDFGFTNEHGLQNQRSAGALVASLRKKGLIEIHEADADCTSNQFSWKMPLAKIEALAGLPISGRQHSNE